MPSTLRSHRKRPTSASSELHLLDLPDSIVQHILAFLPACSLAQALAVSTTMRSQHVPAAIDLRAFALGRRQLPPALKPKDTPLARLQFCEAVAARPAVTISADTCHSIAVSPGGVVRAWGGHLNGPDEDAEDWPLAMLIQGAPCWLSHLGIGKTSGNCVRAPMRIAPLPLPPPMAGASLGPALQVVEVAAGYEHSLLRTANGLVFSCGVGDHGRLGHGGGSQDTSSCFRRIASLEGAVQVAAGGFQSLALGDEGVAYSWGWGESGSTGHGERSHTNLPTAIEQLRTILKVRVVQASAGSGHSLFVTDEGHLYACGDFRHGKLGLGTLITEDVLVPTRVKFREPRVNIAQASAWHAHSLCVTRHGEVYSFGHGQRGRLGHGDERERWRPGLIAALSGVPVRSVSAGELHSCVVSEAGVVYSFGDCTLGQTGTTSVHAILTPQPVPGLEGVAVSELAVGDHHTLIRRQADGALLAFGKNLEGQLGIGSNLAAAAMAASHEGPVPLAHQLASYGHSVAVPTRVQWPEDDDAPHGHEGGAAEEGSPAGAAASPQQLEQQLPPQPPPPQQQLNMPVAAPPPPPAFLA